MKNHYSDHNNDPDVSISSSLKPGPFIRLEARAFPDKGGSIVETINGFDEDTSAEVLGRALSAIIRNAWYLAAEIDRERGEMNGPKVIDSILADWQHDEYQVCMRCGENIDIDGDACLLCGSGDIYREDEDKEQC